MSLIESNLKSYGVFDDPYLTGEILTEYFHWKMLNLSMQINHVSVNVALLTDSCLGLCKTEESCFLEAGSCQQMGEKLAEVSQEAQGFGLLSNMLTIVNSDNVDLKIIVIIQII